MLIFDRCARELESNGYALLPLSALPPRRGGEGGHGTSSVVARAFDSARRALDVASDNEDAAPLIDPSTDSGGWTGHHQAAAVNGRYNHHREGFVFSNGDTFDVMLEDDEDDDCIFEHDMDRLFGLMHDDVAEGVLGAIERRLELPHLYFRREVGPTNVSSQWHMKRYVVDVGHGTPSTPDDNNILARQEKSNESFAPSTLQKEEEIFLPVHTDPSLISVVILDRAGTNEGGMGLEVFHPAKTRDSSKDDGTKLQSAPIGAWKEISHHGHDVAVIFVGSVLSYLTKGRVFSAAKHRVVNWETTRRADADGSIDASSGARMAATLFVRPHADASMKTPPSPHLQFGGEAKKDPPTFRAWNARVAKNYMKKKKRGQRKEARSMTMGSF